MVVIATSSHPKFYILDVSVSAISWTDDVRRALDFADQATAHNWLALINDLTSEELRMTTTLWVEYQ